MREQERKLMCPVPEETCLIVTAVFGEQHDLKMAPDCGKTIHVFPQEARRAAMKFRVTEGAYPVCHLPFSKFSWVLFLSAAIASFLLAPAFS
jgi:hypothetical protein